MARIGIVATTKIRRPNGTVQLKGGSILSRARRSVGKIGRTLARTAKTALVHARRAGVADIARPFYEQGKDMLRGATPKPLQSTISDIVKRAEKSVESSRMYGRGGPIVTRTRRTPRRRETLSASSRKFLAAL